MDGNDHGFGRLAMSGKTHVPLIAACACACLLLQACSFIGEHFVKPGSTVSQISATPDQIVLQYTHDYDTELPAAKQVAEDHCSESGKHATLIETVQRSIDHSWAVFRCE